MTTLKKIINTSSNKIKLIQLIITFFCLFNYASAAYFSFQPHIIEQPNGLKINCFASGDEFFNWLHDKDGYTIIQAPDGFYYYGIEQNGTVVPSSYVVNSVDPSKSGLTKWAKISQENYQKKVDAMFVPSAKGVNGPSVGNMANLVVYVRFNGDTEFATQRSVFDDRFNNPNNISLKHYFDEVSYGNLDITSYHYPISPLSTNLSYEDIYPRSYYQPYNATTNPTGYTDANDRRDREHTLLVNAINHIAPQVPTSLNIDADNDGNVDNVSFIIRGNSGAWADLLWAHRWRLFSQTVYINGKRVWDYTFQPENQSNTGTLCHEMFHVVGAPDLYRYSQDGFVPVGPWDLMASGFAHMGAYMKWKYASQNWISSIPEITAAGTYTLNPITLPTNNAYKIASPSNPNEFFILEYRRTEGFYESTLPASGLLIYRINTSAGNGNAQGPPDEVYLYRPNGTLTQNGTISNAPFSLNSGRTEFNDLTNPPCFLSNNQLAGIEIFNITAADSTISFSYGIDYRPTAFFDALPSVSCNGFIQFADLSSKMPTSWSWDFGDGHTSNLQSPSHTYYTNGYKTVKLVVENAYGVDTIVRTNFVRIDKPNMPNASNQENCTPTTFTLSATPNYGGILKWYNQPDNGTLLNTGNVYQTPLINQTTHYYVEEVVPPQIENVGPASNAIGSGAYFDHANTHYLVFDTYKSLTIKSVLVYAQSDKNRSIVIKDKFDNLLYDTTFYLTTGQHRIELNFDLPADVNYKIECVTPNALLYRSSSGTNFPYNINGLISIHGNSASNLNYYYYFYDWEVLGEECISRRRQITAAIPIPKADFENSSIGLEVSFINNSENTTTYFWDFGDGNSNTSVSPLHNYLAEGYYDVTLIANGSCGTDSVTKQIQVVSTNSPSFNESKYFSIFPNPFSDFLLLTSPDNSSISASVFNNLGQLVYYYHFSGNTSYKLILDYLRQGVYYLNVESNDKIILREKIIKL